MRDDDETRAALAELEEFTRLRAEVRARWRADAPPPAPVAGWDALAAAEAARAHGASEPGMWAELAVAADRLSMRYRAAYARWRQAEALLTRSAPRGEAAQPLRDAHAVAAEIGAEPLLREIVALAQRARITLARAAPAPPAAAAGAALGLTPRELDVLRLLALGRTNPEIAGTLFVSPKTVSTHVTSILRKLGAHTRGEAVAKARRAGVAADPS
ncbi:MAG TPA: response regulator transcription factor [Solirubrobacteraceae bacterium]|nr:response regulator transcription factor [Solirubrobacteraceae bacterium]